MSRKSLSLLRRIIQHISSLLSCLSGLVPLLQNSPRHHLYVLLPEDLINKSTIIDFKSICLEVNTLFLFPKIQDTSVFDPYAGVLFYIYVLLFAQYVDVNKSNYQGPMARRATNPYRAPATSRLTRPAWSPRRLAPIPGTATRDVHCKCRTRPWIWGHRLRGELLCEPAFAHANPPVTQGGELVIFHLDGK